MVILESLLAFAVFTVGGLIIGEIMSGPDPRPDHAIVLALSTASRHPAVAIALATANFPTLNVSSTILVYSLLSGVICALYVRWRRSRSAPAVHAQV